MKSVEGEVAKCSTVLFYAYGASYPDASCVDGRLQDDDCPEYEKGDIPCPFCRPQDYAAYSDDAPIRYVEISGPQPRFGLKVQVYEPE